MRGNRWVGLLVLMAFVFPAFAADEKKDDKKPTADKKKDDKKTDEDKDKDKKTEEKKDKIVQTGVVVGKLQKVENGRVYFQIKERVYGKNEVRDKTVDLEMVDDVQVRLEAPAFAFDDKGRPKKYSKEELAELKGADAKAWGYSGDLESLKPESIIKVFMGKKKGAPQKEPPLVTRIYVAGQPK